MDIVLLIMEFLNACTLITQARILNFVNDIIVHTA